MPPTTSSWRHKNKKNKGTGGTSALVGTCVQEGERKCDHSGVIMDAVGRGSRADQNEGGMRCERRRVKGGKAVEMLEMWREKNPHLPTSQGGGTMKVIVLVVTVGNDC